MRERLPFLISVPHGGTLVPAEIRPLLLLDEPELAHYCDPCTRTIYNFRDRVAAYIETEISRMVIDLNRPPLPLPLKDPDGIIKTRTIDGKAVYREGAVPDLPFIHRLLMAHYFPYHQKIDELIDACPVRVAFDCHAMLPYGSEHQKDAGKARPLICLGNNGDRHGRARKGSIATCSEEWITLLAGRFRDEFGSEGPVAINNPFSGGFIANAHYWRKGVPWIQVEVNRALYEPGLSSPSCTPPLPGDTRHLKERIWRVLSAFAGDIR